MEGGAARSGGVVAGLIEVGWREEGWCAVSPSSLRLVSFIFLFSSSFFSFSPLLVVIGVTLAIAASG